jgi:hypothetical protein
METFHDESSEFNDKASSMSFGSLLCHHVSLKMSLFGLLKNKGMGRMALVWHLPNPWRRTRSLMKSGTSFGTFASRQPTSCRGTIY